LVWQVLRDIKNLRLADLFRWI